MRKVVLQMMTSLNGRIDDPDAWVTGISDDLYAEIDRIYATFDTVLAGQATYAEMSAYWPGAADEAGASEVTKSMARKMNTYKKYVFSGGNEKRELGWNNAEQVLIHSDQDIITFVQGLKAGQGGDIHVAGGARLAQTFVRLGLVDEYHLFVYPVVSLGATWYEQIGSAPPLHLLSATTYESGVVGLYYQPQK